MPFEYLDHTADIGVRGIGKTVEEAFCEAARAIFNLMVDLEEIVPEKAIHVTVEARQLDLLLVEWLSALLVKKDLEGLLLSRFHVELREMENGFSLRGVGWGEPLDLKRHQPKTEVKGVTYAGLRVQKEDERWLAQCVVDI
ncbi:archease [Candidatus Bipolaricaulota bacterium]|nr:archease [Candidatus Bipolaricaulota bacterium]